MEPILGMEEPFRYRNKAQFPIGRDREGKLTAGFYAGRTHSIIPVEDCVAGGSGEPGDPGVRAGIYGGVPCLSL